MFSKSDDYELFKSCYKPPEYLNNEQFIAEKQIKNEHIYSFIMNDENSIESNDLNLTKLKETIKLNNIDFEILHSYGTGIDDLALPDHISTENEINEMLGQLKSFLNKYFLDIRPGCITIARSSLDDYCPADQVDFIQNETIKCLQLFFNNKLSIINKY